MLFLRSLFFAVLLPGTVAVLIPWRIASREGAAPLHSISPIRSLALVPMVLGASILLRCIWEFAAKGRGTLAPIDPPRHLVVTGLYRYVRNPMYVGVLTLLLGEAALFWSAALLAYAAVLFVIVNLFVVLYEEPALRRRFGDSYERYRRAVHRWLPGKPYVLAVLLAATVLAEAAAAQRPPARPGARPPAARVADRWHVETSRSEMTDEPSVTLSLNATNTVQGTILQVRPSLYIRCHERKLELFINSGAVLDGDPEGHTSVRVRWGAKEAGEDDWSRSTDYTAAFAPEPAEFVRQLLATPDLRFEFRPFDAAPRVAVFDARGLSRHLEVLEGACPALKDALTPKESRP